MCGIVGFLGKEQINGHSASIILDCLKTLEYRGYDSAGMAMVENNAIWCKKGVGMVAAVNKECQLEELPGRIGIGHVRWATHGGVKQR